MTLSRPLLAILALAAVARGEGLPLPPAPVRVVIPDAAAFDAALTGPWRAALTGEADEGDPVVKAWRWSPVGLKLEEQWGLLSGDLAWTWTDLMALQPKSIGLSLLSVGNLEVVVVVETPLAELPAEPPEGTEKTYKGISYRVVVKGAGDGSLDVSRRMGLAWARRAGLLFLATSERALLLALDEAVDGHGIAAPLPGVVAVELDTKALRQDRYFKREFLWETDVPDDRIVAALAIENGRLVETREGGAPETAAGMRFATNAAAAGWEAGSAGLLDAIRSGILETIPRPSGRPQLSLAPLPAAEPHKAEDPYLVNLEKPSAASGGSTWEEGELGSWKQLIDAAKPAGWGFAAERDGTRSIVLSIDEAHQGQIEELCRATVARRCGRAAIMTRGGGLKVVSTGPGLDVVAIRRTGAFVWLGTSATALAGMAAPAAEPDLVRWGALDLAAARAEVERWSRVEGESSYDGVRPFSDRLAGLLAWMPSTGRIDVERRKTANGWRERVVFAPAVVSSEP